MANYHNSFAQPVGFPVPEWKECQMPTRSTISGSWCRVELLDAETHTKDLFNAYLKNMTIQTGLICSMARSIALKSLKFG
ncbi:MAG: hypothetical protein CM1200mP30_00370 [Pseudomonadota bacterium]|nr:MAG: hypothetical protein CM1200mP30_00370 [Pseudomonadota bacterium]